ncbi:hypothetical protein P9112_013740 [Eukaryota sp. TZLM1-RC]
MVGEVADPSMAINEHFKQFLEGHCLEAIERFTQVHPPRFTLSISLNAIAHFSQELALSIRHKYYLMEPSLIRSFTTVLSTRFPDFIEAHPSQIFSLAIHDVDPTISLREIRCSRIGSLLSIKGTVIRTSDVRPELLYGTFVCPKCGSSVRNVRQQYQFTTPTCCSNNECSNTNGFRFQPNQSVWIDWQRVRIQEESSTVPPGSMPRSLDVILRHDDVGSLKPGDTVKISGTVVALPDEILVSSKEKKTTRNRRATGESAGVSGLTSGVQDVSFRLAFVVSSIQEYLKGGLQLVEVSENQQDRVLSMAKNPTIEHDLIRSICPAVHGHEDLKRGVLLMLLGGVVKKSQTITLRGDLNLCIVGDPATAKSKILKWVSSFIPRAVYTSGKASSAAGLTASVTRDNETGDYALEAGAMLLADGSVCCIDEFDKMESKDSSAIHEAMEQQTISVAKAGIRATLSSRASVLAACNPIGGRYDTHKTLRQNVSLTPPIMSRFDLFFVIRDNYSVTHDVAVARHIVSLHQQTNSLINMTYTPQDIANYVRFAKQVNPKLTEEAKQEVIKEYAKMRRDDTGVTKTSFRITIRQLEALIRLSEAFARLYFNDKVNLFHVSSAARLLKATRLYVDAEPIELDIGQNEEEIERNLIEENNDNEPAEEQQDVMDGDEDQSEMMEGQNDDEQVNGSHESSNKVTIKRADYERLMRVAAEFIKTKEVTPFAGVAQRDIIDHVLGAFDDFASIEDLIKRRMVIKHLIIQLTERDLVFIVAKYAKLDDEESRLITLNPNVSFE